MVVISSLIHPRRIDSRRLNARSVIAALTVLAAARSHSGSDSRLRLSFIALVPLRYAGTSFTPAPFDSPFMIAKKAPPWGAFLFGGA